MNCLEVIKLLFYNYVWLFIAGTDGRMDGCTDERMDGQTDGHIEIDIQTDTKT